ncbi:hypothetical protein GWI33_022498 [Rhynchophorus ferrugineus]|uniref:Uncharacterized protein n=1 Tax=Rhynchophorus ferrugineus TaxID=354439 RepID=A0A834MHJ4_RHYFE|nr:hypothetical protein GWI33_022498 [Rhynchophorus ferrugineus]
MLIKFLIVSLIIINGYDSCRAEYCHCDNGCVSITYNIGDKQNTIVKCLTTEEETCKYYTASDPSIISCNYHPNGLSVLNDLADGPITENSNSTASSTTMTTTTSNTSPTTANSTTTKITSKTLSTTGKTIWTTLSSTTSRTTPTTASTSTHNPNNENTTPSTAFTFLASSNIVLTCLFSINSNQNHLVMVQVWRKARQEGNIFYHPPSIESPTDIPFQKSKVSQSSEPSTLASQSLLSKIDRMSS